MGYCRTQRVVHIVIQLILNWYLCSQRVVQIPTLDHGCTKVSVGTADHSRGLFFLGEVTGCLCFGAVYILLNAMVYSSPVYWRGKET